MPVAYNFKRGIDLPSWQWLNPFFSPSYHGTSNCYDGDRYVYWSVQSGVTSTAAGTTYLWRFDTWTNGWHFLATLTSGNAGIDLEWDDFRKGVWITHGVSLTSWQFFNPNTTTVTLHNGLTAAPFALSAALTPVLPGAANLGAALAQPSDDRVTAGGILVGTAGAGSTTTSIVGGGDALDDIHAGMIGCVIRFTAGALSGQQRIITATPTSNTMTVTAFGGAPATGDAFVIECPGVGVAIAATSGTASTIVSTGAGFPTNQYRDSDVIIVAGTGIGQRRRIASNTTDTLTLSAAVTGNANTGNWGVTPDATSTFRIVPSRDFLYYASGNNTATIWRLDTSGSTGMAWAALTAIPGAIASGGNVLHAPKTAPFSLMCFRGNNTANVYRYDIGLQTWATLTTLWGGELLTTGGGAAGLPSTVGNRFVIQVAASNRVYTYRVATGKLDAVTALPYAAPVGYDGKRLRVITTADGAQFLYFMRAGGQEFFRLPLEWF